jgi:hypothetical protein
VAVTTVQTESKGNPDSADACRRPCVKNNTGTPYTVEDRGNGGLAPPVVHHSKTVGLPAFKKTGSPLIGLRT